MDVEIKVYWAVRVIGWDILLVSHHGGILIGRTSIQEIGQGGKGIEVVLSTL